MKWGVLTDSDDDSKIHISSSIVKTALSAFRKRKVKKIEEKK